MKAQTFASCLRRGLRSRGLYVGVLLLATGSVSAQTPGPAAPPSRTPMELGGLHRAAASLEVVLDVYRLALVELVPAARRVAAAGLDPDAGVTTPVPEPAHEVFARLAASVSSRTPAAALPVIARGYHAEVIEALEQLAQAESLPATVAPFTALAQAMAHLCDSGDAIVDLFSRQRPIHVKLVDPSTTLDDIGEALDEVAEAERGIVALRQRKAPMREALRAFERLEVTLGHALDLIAVADEAGLHIGFEAPRATGEFGKLVARVREQLGELQQVLTTFDVKSTPVSAEVVAVLVAATPGNLEARLSWKPVDMGPTPAAVRIYRRTDLRELKERLALALRCAGKDADSAAREADLEVAQVSGEPVRVAELPSGRSSFTDPLGELPLVAPRYTVVTTTSFGTESPPRDATVIYLPPLPTGAPFVSARVLAPAAEHPDFYELYDQVAVLWQRSPNDPSEVAATLASMVEPPPLLKVTGYRVTRMVAGVPQVVATLPAGTLSFIDRLPAEVIAVGTCSYRVETLFADGKVMLPPSTCAETAVSLAGVQQRLEAAKAGLGALVRPSSWERERRQSLERDADFAQARAAFLAQPAAVQAERLSAWWAAVPERERRAWLTRWPSYVPAEERVAWLAQLPQTLSERDVPWVRLEAFLMDQPEELRKEAERWWSLLDTGARAAALAQWEAQLNLAQRLELYGKRSDGGGGEWQASRPARLLAWWQSRDPQEQERVAAWWAGLTEADRTQRVMAWVAGQSDVTRTALRWPDFDRRTPQEQQQLLDIAWQELPRGLLKEALVGIGWQELVQQGGEPLTKVLAQDVSGLRRAWIALRYATRPWDLSFGFHLFGLLVTALAALAGGGLWWWRKRR